MNIRKVVAELYGVSVTRVTRADRLDESASNTVTLACEAGSALLARRGDVPASVCESGEGVIVVGGTHAAYLKDAGGTIVREIPANLAGGEADPSHAANELTVEDVREWVAANLGEVTADDAVSATEFDAIDNAKTVEEALASVAKLFPASVVEALTRGGYARPKAGRPRHGPHAFNVKGTPGGKMAHLKAPSLNGVKSAHNLKSAIGKAVREGDADDAGRRLAALSEWVASAALPKIEDPAAAIAAFDDAVAAKDYGAAFAAVESIAEAAGLTAELYALPQWDGVSEEAHAVQSALTEWEGRLKNVSYVESAADVSGRGVFAYPTAFISMRPGRYVPEYKMVVNCGESAAGVIAAAANGANVPYAYGKAADGRHQFVMEHDEGANLLATLAGEQTAEDAAGTMPYFRRNARRRVHENTNFIGDVPSAPEVRFPVGADAAGAGRNATEPNSTTLGIPLPPDPGGPKQWGRVAGPGASFLSPANVAPVSKWEWISTGDGFDSPDVTERLCRTAESLAAATGRRHMLLVSPSETTAVVVGEGEESMYGDADYAVAYETADDVAVPKGQGTYPDIWRGGYKDGKANGNGGPPSDAALASAAKWIRRVAQIQELNYNDKNVKDGLFKAYGQGYAAGGKAKAESIDPDPDSDPDDDDDDVDEAFKRKHVLVLGDSDADDEDKDNADRTVKKAIKAHGGKLHGFEPDGGSWSASFPHAGNHAAFVKHVNSKTKLSAHYDTAESAVDEGPLVEPHLATVPHKAKFGHKVIRGFAKAAQSMPNKTTYVLKPTTSREDVHKSLESNGWKRQANSPGGVGVYKHAEQPGQTIKHYHKTGTLTHHYNYAEESVVDESASSSIKNSLSGVAERPVVQGTNKRPRYQHTVKAGVTPTTVAKHLAKAGWRRTAQTPDVDTYVNGNYSGHTLKHVHAGNDHHIMHQLPIREGASFFAGRGAATVENDSDETYTVVVTADDDADADDVDDTVSSAADDNDGDVETTDDGEWSVTFDDEDDADAFLDAVKGADGVASAKMESAGCTCAPGACNC